MEDLADDCSLVVDDVLIVRRPAVALARPAPRQLGFHIGGRPVASQPARAGGDAPAVRLQAGVHQKLAALTFGTAA